MNTDKIYLLLFCCKSWSTTENNSFWVHKQQCYHCFQSQFEVPLSSDETGITMFNTLNCPASFVYSQHSQSLNSLEVHIQVNLGVYFFRMFGMCRTCSSEWSGMEHSARTNRTVCGVYHVLRWCKRNQDGGTDYLFFYIEFFYTLLVFLRLGHTKEMCGFFGGEEGLCKLWIQSPIVL